MAQNDILTLSEIKSFAPRFRPPVAAAAESQRLREALFRLIRESGGAGGRAARANGEAAATRGGRGGARGRKARVSDQTIVDLLRGAGPSGLGMRDLEKELKQHPE